MKVFAVVALLAIVAYTSAAVVPEVVYDGPMLGEEGEKITLEDVDTDGGLAVSTELSPVRHRRITCDLLSISTPFGTLNHAGCATKCLAQGRKGGYCKDGACICR